MLDIRLTCQLPVLLTRRLRTLLWLSWFWAVSRSCPSLDRFKTEPSRTRPYWNSRTTLTTNYPVIGILPASYWTGQEGGTFVWARRRQPRYCSYHLPPRWWCYQGVQRPERSPHRQQACQGTLIFHHIVFQLPDFLTLPQVEVVVSNAELIPQPKSLTQRITQPKAQPKSAATVKHTANAPKGAAAAKRGDKKGPRRPRNARPAKKTVEELDSEMADYFESGNTDNATGAAPAAANGGDAPMEDEILWTNDVHEEQQQSMRAITSFSGDFVWRISDSLWLFYYFFGYGQGFQLRSTAWCNFLRDFTTTFKLSPLHYSYGNDVLPNDGFAATYHLESVVYGCFDGKLQTTGRDGHYLVPYRQHLSVTVSAFRIPRSVP